MTLIGVSHSGSGSLNASGLNINASIVLPPQKQPISDWQVPVDNANYFIQRDEFYTPLTAYFDKDITKQSIIVVNAGLGGVGKTQLAVYYCHHTLKAYPLKCWFKANSRDGLFVEYREFCNSQQILPPEPTPIAIIQAVRNWFSDSNRPHWLIVYDDAVDQNMLQEFLPSKGGDIIITTRYQDWSYSKLSVTVMTELEAIALLKKSIDPEDKLIFTEQNEAELRTLAEKLGQLPLALAQAGAYIHASMGRVSIANYLERFEKYRVKLLEDKKLPAGQNHEPVAVTWGITLTAMQKKCSKAIKLLEALSFLDSKRIPNFLLETWTKQGEQPWDELELEDALRTATEYSMVQQSKHGNEITYAMHNLVQLVIRSGLIGDYRQICLIQWMKCINQLHEEINATDSPLLIEQVENQLLAHSNSILDYVKNEHCFDAKPEKVLFYEIISDIYFKLGYPQKQKELLEQVLEIQVTHYGQRHWKTAITFGNLAAAYIALGDYKKSKELLEKALDIEVAFYGRGRLQTASILENLANVYNTLGDYKKSKELLEEALDIQVARYGRRHWQTASIINNLAAVYGKLENDKKKKELLEEALDIEVVRYGQGHWVTAVILENLAIVYGDLGDYKKKKDLLEEVLGINVAHYGRRHWQTASTLYNLANAYGDLGNDQKKKAFLEEVLDIEVAYYGQGHWKTASTHRNLANAYGALGDNKKKKELLKKVLDIEVAHYGQGHWQTTSTLNNLANAYGNLGNHKKKKELLEEALDIEVAHYGQGHWQTANTLKNLAYAYDNWGNYKKSKELLEEVIGIEVAHYGLGHWKVGITVFNFARANLKLGELNFTYETLGYAYNCLLSHPLNSAYPPAKELKQFLARIESLVLIQNNQQNSSTNKINQPILFTPLTLAGKVKISSAVLESLLRQINQKNTEAVIYYKAKDYGKALKLWQNAAEIVENVSKEDYPNYHDELAALYANIGTMHTYLSHHEEAISYFKKSIALREEKHGINCKEAQKSRYKLVDIERQFFEVSQKKIPATPVSLKINRNSSMQSTQSLGENDFNPLLNLPSLFTPSTPLAVKMRMSSAELQLLLEQIVQKNTEAVTCYKAKDCRKALKLWQKAAEILENVSKEDYPNYHDELALLYSNIGKAHKNLGYPKEAIRFFKQSIALREEKYGINYPEAQKSRDKLRLSYLLSAPSLSKNDFSSFVNVLPIFFTSTDESSSIKSKEGLKNEKKLTKVLEQYLPADLIFGKAHAQGDCFFDALAQCLNKINSTDINTDKYLRILCHNYYGKNKALVDKLNTKDYGGIDKQDDYSMVQYTVEECNKHFHGRSPIWGRPYVEGIMLCNQLNLRGLCIIEILEHPETKQSIPSFHWVNQESYTSISEQEAKEKMSNPEIPTLVVEQNSLHFVPLLLSDITTLDAEIPPETLKKTDVSSSIQYHSKTFDNISSANRQSRELGSNGQFFSPLPRSSSKSLDLEASQNQEFDTREKLSSETMVKSRLSSLVLTQFTLGAAIGKGDCFFDSVAQALNKLRNTSKYNIKSLRLLCEEYVKSNEHAWVKQALINDEGGESGYHNYLARIAFTAEEMNEHEQLNTLKGSAVWGRPDIEGKIICEKLEINLHIIEARDEGEIAEGVLSTEQIINSLSCRGIEPLNPEEYSQTNLIHLVNFKNHFVPLLLTTGSASLILETKPSTEYLSASMN